MKNCAFSAILIASLLSPLANGAADEAEPNIARVMWTAFSCATFAEMSGNSQEQERLFNLGFNAGRIFVDGVRNHTISEADTKRAPIGVLMHLAGPTTDFIVGRIFEGANEDAFDKVVKQDATGAPIVDPSNWANDELKVMRAKNMYLFSNCELIR